MQVHTMICFVVELTLHAEHAAMFEEKLISLLGQPDDSGFAFESNTRDLCWRYDEYQDASDAYAKVSRTLVELNRDFTLEVVCEQITRFELPA